MKYCNAYWMDVDKVIDWIPNNSLLKGKRVLLTGVTGMLLSPVADILLRLNQKDYNIRLYFAGRDKNKIIDRFKPFMEGSDYYFAEYNLFEDIIWDMDIDYIIHGAGYGDPASIREKPAENLIGSIIGTNNILRWVSNRKKGRVLFVSSSEVYGNRTITNGAFKEEDYSFVDLLNPRAVYPMGKRSSETLCAAYTEEYQVDSVIARPGHIYGPTISRKDSRASAVFTWNVVDGQQIEMKSAGEQIRSYTYVMDCASAILTIILNGETGKAYNISNKDSVVSIRAFAEMLAECANTRISVSDATSEEKKGYNMMINSSLDATRLEMLGWKAMFNLREGIVRTIDYLR